MAFQHSFLHLPPSLSFHPMTHVPRYVPARTNDGWPIVGLISVIAAALIIAVAVIHQRTYRHPTNPVSPAPASESASTH